MSAERAPSRQIIGLPRPSAGWLRSVVEGPIRVAERALGLSQLDEFARAVEDGDRSVPVMERVITAMSLHPQYSKSELERIPATGPVMVASNHPFGGADGAALLAAVLRRRPDAKLLVNGMVMRLPFFSEHAIGVDPFGGSDAPRRNALALRDAMRWIKDGHVLVVFPAGEVSAVSWGEWTPHDALWSTVAFRLAMTAKARVVPAWVEGTNRGVFHAAGLLHPRLRTALLPNEFVARCGKTIEMRFGRAIATEGSSLDAEELTRFVRGRSELLRRTARATRGHLAQQSHAPVAAQAATPEQLEAEFKALPAGARLFSEGAFDVFATRASAIPQAMTEIGRLREIAFRAVGEGSGKPIDIDAFDPSYTQLIVWHREKREIVGGYRAGVVAELTKDKGVSGLYTSTLFEYSPRILAELGDAVELGRSFVRVEYQRQPMPLSLLWKGIGVFMFMNGHRRMFGPVSISNDYTSMSKELIMEFLERHRMSTPFAKLVSPRNPPARQGVACWTERERAEATADLLNVERLIEEIERGERAVPVLLRQYLRLNAKLLAFNVDADFGDVIDALMLVDIAQIDDRIVRHYVGDDAMATFKQRFAGE